MSEALFTLEQLLYWTHGKLISNADVVISSVAVDSRKCTVGSLFFCLLGERVDGHDFIHQAIQKGSSGIVVSYLWLGKNKKEVHRLSEENNEVFIIVVDDPLISLQDTAFGYMKTITTPVKIGITGSNAKTTTKELIASVLNQKYCVVKTEGNLNSEIGLPLTVFTIKNYHEFAVIEIGINRIGEMDILAKILQPDIVVITNIGSAHIGNFKDIKTIAFEKKKATTFFTKNSRIFLDENEPFKNYLSEGIKGATSFYGEKIAKKIFPHLTVKNLGLSGWEINFNDGCVVMPLIGEYNLKNALCASIIGFKLGLNTEEIAKGLASVENPSGRGQVIQGEVTIIDDCYNANADSMIKSLSFISGLKWPSRKILVVGDMYELGDKTAVAHENIVKILAENNFDLVILFGKYFKKALDALMINDQVNEAVNNSLKHFQSYKEYSEMENNLLKYLKKGDLLLLKASRSMRLEKLIEPVMSKFGGKLC